VLYNDHIILLPTFTVRYSLDWGLGTFCKTRTWWKN